jgi:hypothetical protein
VCHAESFKSVALFAPALHRRRWSPCDRSGRGGGAAVRSVAAAERRLSPTDSPVFSALCNAGCKERQSYRARTPVVGVHHGNGDQDAERHRRNDKRAYLLVAAPWDREAVGEGHLLHEGRRSRLRGRLLQGVTCRARILVAQDRMRQSRLFKIQYAAITAMKNDMRSARPATAAIMVA